MVIVTDSDFSIGPLQSITSQIQQPNNAVKKGTRMIRSKRAMGFLWVALALLFHAWPYVPVAKGQGTRKDDIVFNSRGVPLAGATVRVCAMPASGQPCTPLALIYSDPGLTQALANPTTSDGLGNYFFYAAPGKYEIEISGPGITTKQIPNVILPSDPTAPSFTGAISAFSLNLTGNLTVNGSTTVLGNLASGNLNLTNQAASPGTASTGTVNLYSKTDKRLYYIDDTGTEIGPISNTSGAQTNVTNTFTAPQNFDGDTHTKGPNPVIDLMRFGGYFEPSNAPVTTTGSINSSSTTLTLASAQNFANGQGIVVQGAGLTPVGRNASFPAVPTVGTVTPLGVINGTTTYNYKFVVEDYFGGLTAAGTQGSTTVGAATLGINTVLLTGMVRSSGIDTFTCASNCNVAVNSLVQISGFASQTVDGTVVIASTPSSTTFTVNAQGQPDYTETASGTLSVRACNALLPSGTLSQESVILRTWIYRNNTLVGVSPGQDPFFIDCNQGVQAPSYVPTTAPVSAQPGYLATTIISGGGTTTLTLANAAGTTVSAQTVQHDNSQNLIAAWAAAYAAHGGVVRIPIIGSGGFNTFPFNATTNLATVTNSQAATVKLQVSSATMNQPLIPANFSEMEGIPQAATSFQYSPLGSVSGTAQPLILINHSTTGGVTISKIKFGAFGTGASSLVLDQVVGGGGEVGFIFNDNGYSSNNASPIVIKGGFDFWFTHGVCSTGGTENGQWYAHPCMELTNASSYLSASATQVPGRIKIYDMNFQGSTAIQQDNYPSMNQVGTFVNGQLNLIANGLLHEANNGPTIRIALGVGLSQAFGGGLDLSDVITADPANGLHQPLVEMTGTTGFNAITFRNNKSAGGQSILNGGGSGAASLCINNTFVGCGQTSNLNFNGSYSTNDGGIIGLINGGSIGYLMPTPAAPASCVVSSGGSVPVTTGLQYLIVAADRSPISFSPFAGMTPLSPACTVNTTSGNQTVTVTRPALPAGAVGWLVWRGTPGAVGEAQLPFGCVTPIPASTTTFVDTFSFGCGASAPNADTAFVSGINSSGVNTGAISISGESLTASPRAEQNIFLPGALTSTWTGSTWTLDKAVTVTRVQAQAKTAPSGCTTNAIVRLTDGTTPVNVTISAAANDSGAISQAYAAGSSLTVGVQTAAAGCTTSPADVNVIVQYRMQ